MRRNLVTPYLNQLGTITLSNNMTPEILEIKTVFKGLQTLYDIHLPKADPALVHDLLVREEEKSAPAPFYMVEIFTKEGTDSEAMRNHIIE
jgi:hypothetical protein